MLNTPCMNMSCPICLFLIYVALPWALSLWPTDFGHEIFGPVPNGHGGTPIALFHGKSQDDQ